MNEAKWEDDGDGKLIGHLLFKPSNWRELTGLFDLASIGFDPYTEDGQGATLRCFRKHFCVENDD